MRVPCYNEGQSPTILRTPTNPAMNRPGHFEPLRGLYPRLALLALVVGLALSAADPLASSAAPSLGPVHRQGKPSGRQVGVACPASGIAAIDAVRGVVAESASARTHRSPCAPALAGSAAPRVTVQGVISLTTLARGWGGGLDHGFFVQNAPAMADADPATSDGIFVSLGRFASARREGGGLYTPRIGDEVVLRGPVVEASGQTQLTNPFLVDIRRSGVDLERELPPVEVRPPDDRTAAERSWERLEGMRAQVPAGSVAVSSRKFFESTGDAETWVMRGDRPVAQRPDPFARRVFRDPHPLDDVPGQRWGDGNGYRIALGSLGLKGASGDVSAAIAPVRTFDRLTRGPVGVVSYAFGRYAVQIGEQLTVEQGADPSGNNPPMPADRARELSVATFNLENLYDDRDDPNDGCDAPGDVGCPGVAPPYTYLPASGAAYQDRLGRIARQIVDDLHSPDILLLQEAEDQDICVVQGDALNCGTAENADGQPDTLQELSLAIQRIGGPPYVAAADRDGADDRGILSGFLYRLDRVELLPPDPSDPVLGSTPTVQYRGTATPANAQTQNPKALNAALPDDVDRSTGTDGADVFTRAAQIALFRVWRDGIGASPFVDLYVVDNHFSSTPTARVGQRREQAAYVAAIVAALQTTDDAAVGSEVADDGDTERREIGRRAASSTTASSSVRIVVGGDLNVQPRPDDPFSPGEAGFPSDQLAPFYEQGLTNLWDVLASEAPASAYSYVFDGQAQTLDHLFVSPVLLGELVEIRAAHVNADWPDDDPSAGSRGVSDHDPQVARFASLASDRARTSYARFFEDRREIANGH
ncbi:MAG: hypothetical protein IT305_13120 [Chloroflexi bacterium]|nr:hypothetical protein [Chloroflexota bacterium]